MRTVFQNLVLSGILIGAAAVSVAAQSGPNRQERQGKEKIQAVLANKNEKPRTGPGNSGNNPRPAKGEKR